MFCSKSTQANNQNQAKTCNLVSNTQQQSQTTVKFSINNQYKQERFNTQSQKHGKNRDLLRRGDSTVVSGRAFLRSCASSCSLRELVACMTQQPMTPGTTPQTVAKTKKKGLESLVFLTSHRQVSLFSQRIDMDLSSSSSSSSSSRETLEIDPSFPYLMY